MYKWLSDYFFLPQGEKIQPKTSFRLRYYNQAKNKIQYNIINLFSMYKQHSNEDVKNKGRAAFCNEI